MSLAEFLLRGDMKNLKLSDSRHRVSDSNLKPWVQVPICVLARLRPLVLSVSKSAKIKTKEYLKKKKKALEAFNEPEEQIKTT